MCDVVLGLDQALELAAALDQVRELAGLDAGFDRGVEGAAEGDVDVGVPDPQPFGVDERGNVAEAHRTDAAVLDLRPGVEAARRHVHDDVVLAFPALDDPLVERPGHERDRAVAARGRVAGVVEEDDAEVGAVVVRRNDEAAVHVRVTAGLEDEEAADVVEPLERVAAAVEDRLTAERVDAGRDDAEGLASGVVVDGGYRHAVAA